MGWLSGYTNRSPISVANATTAGNRALDAIDFSNGPLWRALGLIARTDFADVHVTTADGTTELPVTLNAAHTALYIDYASMPQGRTTLYAYFGKADASAPTGVAYYTAARGTASIVTQAWVESGGTLDALEGTDGTSITDGWSTTGSPTAFVFDNDFPFAGTTGARLTAAGVSGHAIKTIALTADGAEFRWWVYIQSLTENLSFSDPTTDVADQSFFLRFGGASGVIQNYTNRSVTGYTQNNYTQVGTFSEDTLYEVRVILDFTNDTFTADIRTALGGSWTGLKASGASDYNIPFRGANNITTTVGWRGSAAAGKTAYFDEVRYSASGITEALVPAATATSTLVIGPREVYTAEDGLPTAYIAGADVKAVRIAHDTADATAENHYYGADAAIFAGRSEWEDGEENWHEEDNHALVGFFEGAAPKGTISAARLHCYVTPTITSALELRAYPLKNTGDATSAYWSAVRTGWTNQAAGYPTWNNRMLDWQPGGAGTARAWLTPGATNSEEIDSTLYDALALTSSTTIGWQYFDIDPAKATAWLGDTYSSGVLIKHEAVTGADNYVSLVPPGGDNGPVWELTYSAVDANQLDGRKLTTDVYHYGTFPVQARHASVDAEHGFMVQTWADQDLTLGVAIISQDGRIARVAKGAAPTGEHLHYNTPICGISHDSSDGRWWEVGVDDDGSLCVAYTAPYDPTAFTYVVHPTITTGKSAAIPVGGVSNIFALDTADSDKLKSLTYTRSTDTWSAATDVYTPVCADVRTLTGDIAADVTSIELSGTLAGYPAWGCVKIDTEYKWYSGKSGNTLTGVVGGIHGTTAATHSSGAAVSPSIGMPTYTSIARDPVREGYWVTWSNNRDEAGSVYEYQSVGCLFHADTGEWKAPDGTELTLPIAPADIPLVSDPAAPCYTNSLLVTDSGDIIINFERFTTAASAPSDYNKTMVAYLHYGQTAFTLVDLADNNSYGACVDLGGDDVAMLDIAGASQYVRYTDDAGETFGTEQTIQTHTFTQRPISNPGVSSNARMLDTGLAYVQHSTTHGAIFLSAVAFPPAAPSNVAGDGTGHVTLTDNATSEDGIRYKVAYDGGAYGAPVTIATPNTVAFDFSVEAGHASYIVAVCAYRAAAESDYVASESVALASVRRFRLLPIPIGV